VHNFPANTLYGATDGGLLFRVSTSRQYDLLYTMAHLAVDGGCQCQLAQGSDGTIRNAVLFVWNSDFAHGSAEPLARTWHSSRT
jgi:hypothetical protein